MRKAMMLVGLLVVGACAAPPQPPRSQAATELRPYTADIMLPDLSPNDRAAAELAALLFAAERCGGTSALRVASALIAARVYLAKMPDQRPALPMRVYAEARAALVLDHRMTDSPRCSTVIPLAEPGVRYFVTDRSPGQQLLDARDATFFHALHALTLAERCNLALPNQGAARLEADRRLGNMADTERRAAFREAANARAEATLGGPNRSLRCATAMALMTTGIDILMIPQPAGAATPKTRR